MELRNISYLAIGRKKLIKKHYVHDKSTFSDGAFLLDLNLSDWLKLRNLAFMRVSELYFPPCDITVTLICSFHDF